MTAEENLAELRKSLAGDGLGPTDAEYDAARLCFNLLIARRPAAIARDLIAVASMQVGTDQIS
jgi:hypothetical protein